MAPVTAAAAAASTAPAPACLGSSLSWKAQPVGDARTEPLPSPPSPSVAAGRLATAPPPQALDSAAPVLPAAPALSAAGGTDPSSVSRAATFASALLPRASATPGPWIQQDLAGGMDAWIQEHFGLSFEAGEVADVAGSTRTGTALVDWAPEPSRAPQAPKPQTAAAVEEYAAASRPLQQLLPPEAPTGSTRSLFEKAGAVWLAPGPMLQSTAVTRAEGVARGLAAGPCAWDGGVAEDARLTVGGRRATALQAWARDALPVWDAGSALDCGGGAGRGGRGVSSYFLAEGASRSNDDSASRPLEPQHASQQHLRSAAEAARHDTDGGDAFVVLPRAGPSPLLQAVFDLMPPAPPHGGHRGARRQGGSAPSPAADGLLGGDGVIDTAHG
ncbi:hypothetical protein HYH03_015911 [Edaphochlamys debaryana]|uniref:Uncharacterized protein n=1 Tax=Edaphochlamys debaryana TaxID=47281 RepID=A0A835XSR5_9CHLO|nr:hypothetical protein HYH03_015911 [Edaphochlamys debaryana]|eukprot:KAG2485329.1 hypothetical protein HYH03_015911 [Edaphochlamys debaryana]